MKRKANLLALIASTSLVTGCGPDAQLQVRAVGAQAVLPIGDLLAEGRTNYALNNVALALEQFRRAERLQPDSVDALNGIAACYDRMGRFDLSRGYYEKALAIAPTNPKTLHNFAVSLTMQGRNAEATALAQATAQSPQPAQPLPAPAASVATANGAQAVIVALPPAPEKPAPRPQARPPEQIAAARPAPAERTLPGPHLERLSLSEVELVTIPPAKQPAAARQRQAERTKVRPAERVVQVAQAKLVRATSTSSEWVFPEAPAKAVQPAPPPVVAKPAAAAAPAAPAPTPAPTITIAAVAPPAPKPVPVVRTAAVAPPVPTPKTVPAAMAAPRLEVAHAAAPPAAKPVSPSVVAKPAPTPAPTLRLAKAPAATPRLAGRMTVQAVAPRVQLFNAVGRRGLAARYSLYLKTHGWTDRRTADARRMRTMTVIRYPVGSRAQAAALAKRLPFRAVLAPTNRVGSDLLLVLGSDALAFDNRLRVRVSRA